MLEANLTSFNTSKLITISVSVLKNIQHHKAQRFGDWLPVWYLECQTKEHSRMYTFFAGLHPPLPKVLELMYFWTEEMEVKQTTDHISVSSPMVA